MIRTIFEMSFERKLIIKQIEEFRFKINEHLLKYYLFINHESKNHWLDEIDNYIYEINDMTIDGKHKLKVRDYYREFFEKPFEPENYDSIERLIEKIMFQYNKNKFYKIKKYDIKELYYRFKKFYLELSNKIVDIHFRIIDIDELVIKYWV